MNQILHFLAMAAQLLSGGRRLKRSDSTSTLRCHHDSYDNSCHNFHYSFHIIIFVIILIILITKIISNLISYVQGWGQPAQGDVGAIGVDGEENRTVCRGRGGGRSRQLLVFVFVPVFVFLPVFVFIPVFVFVCIFVFLLEAEFVFAF